VAGVEGAVGVLEDHLHLTAQAPQVRALGAGDVLAVELDAAAGRLEELEHRAAGGGLAAAGLPHQAEGLALAQLQGDAVDGLDGGVGPLDQGLAELREVLLQVGDPQQGLAAGVGCGRGGRGDGGAHAGVVLPVTAAA